MEPGYPLRGQSRTIYMYFNQKGGKQYKSIHSSGAKKL